MIRDIDKSEKHQIHRKLIKEICTELLDERKSQDDLITFRRGDFEKILDELTQDVAALVTEKVYRALTAES